MIDRSTDLNQIWNLGYCISSFLIGSLDLIFQPAFFSQLGFRHWNTAETKRLGSHSPVNFDHLHAIVYRCERKPAQRTTINWGNLPGNWRGNLRKIYKIYSPKGLRYFSSQTFFSDFRSLTPRVKQQASEARDILVCKCVIYMCL